MGLVGVSSSATLGDWRMVEFEGRQVPFLPVARPSKGHLPDSLKLASGILIYRAQLPRATYQVHRVELGWLIGRVLRKPMVQFIHNDASGLLSSRSDSIWRHAPGFYRFLERGSLQHAKAVALFNQSDAPRLQRLRPDLFIAQTGFDESLVPNDISPPHRGPLVLTWVGRLESQKNPFLLIDIADRLVQNGTDFLLNVVGEGSLRAEMERQVASSPNLKSVFNFVGTAPRAAVYQIMSASHAVVMTSHYEGSPTVLIEANANGAPVVCNEASDPDRRISNQVNGFKVPDNAVAAYVEAILRVTVISRRKCKEAVSDRSATKVVQELLRISLS